MSADAFPNDRHRPRYHFLPPRNWMNDPNGLIHWRGRYHLFYQHNPFGAFWGTMHWGHAVSADLVHWAHLPIALAPDPDGPDADGCFSGCAIDHNGVPTLLYTGVRGDHQLPCLATSADDDLLTWTKHPGNPVIAAPPAELATTMYRDHSAWREGGEWRQIVGAGIAGVGGAALLYRSDDLRTWEYLHPLVVETEAMSNADRPTVGWECPDVFRLGDRWALVACFWDGEPISVSYLTGELVDERFVPAYQGIVDAGECFYAPQSFADEQGRRVMFGWLREARPVAAQIAAGWSGVMSLPRVVSLRPDGTLAFAPAPEVAVLRGHRVSVPGSDVAPGADVPLDGIAGDALELQVAFAAGGTDVVGVEVRRANHGAEVTRVLYDPTRSTLSLDTRHASTDPEVSGGLYAAQAELAADEAVRLRVFVDRSVVEVFLNDRVAISGRVYPTLPDSLGVRVVGALAGPVDAWAMHDA
ncbi:MAG TPA: glycoside hydrolase family 32 protein [Thermomicrobiales bacterium]|nr:glycoside hydrolase family 32 protein [Thermomicrobiales bacterium]